jgi:hypothetical protein
LSRCCQQLPDEPRNVRFHGSFADGSTGDLQVGWARRGRSRPARGRAAAVKLLRISTAMAATTVETLASLPVPSLKVRLARGRLWSGPDGRIMASNLLTNRIQLSRLNPTSTGTISVRTSIHAICLPRPLWFSSGERFVPELKPNFLNCCAAVLGPTVAKIYCLPRAGG